MLPGAPATILSYPRIVKVDAQGNLVQTFAAASTDPGIRPMDEWANYGVGYINKLVYINKFREDGTDLLVIGSNGEFGTDAGTYEKYRGIVHKLDQNGTSVSAFASGGIYSPDFTDLGYNRFTFYDVNKTMDGLYLLFGGGREIASNGSNALILPLASSNGALQTSYGNNGKLFESFEFTNIQHAITRYPAGGTTEDAEIIVMGMTDSSFVSSNFGFRPASAMAKLIWEDKGGPVSVKEINADNVITYPNPVVDVLHIIAKTPAAAIITSSTGAIVRELEFNGETTLDVSTYALGVYFIRTAEGQTVKFVKE